MCCCKFLMLHFLSYTWPKNVHFMILTNQTLPQKASSAQGVNKMLGVTYPLCSNEFIGAPIGSIMFLFDTSRLKRSQGESYTTHDYNIVSFDFQTLHHFEHYWTYRCTDNFIGTNCTLLLLLSKRPCPIK